MKRHIGLAIHGGLALVIVGWSLWGAYTFWQFVFLTPWAAVGALLLIEAFALAGFALHVLGIPSPVAAARHLLPVASAAPALHSIHALAKGVGDREAWALAGIVTLVLMLASYAVWRGLEALLLDRALLVQAEVEARAKHAEVAVQRIAAEAAAMVRIITAMRNAVQAHERAALPPAADLVLARVTSYPEPQPAMPDSSPSATVRTSDAAPRYQCPNCGATLANLGQYGAARKHGYCRHCRPGTEARNG